MRRERIAAVVAVGAAAAVRIATPAAVLAAARRAAIIGKAESTTEALVEREAVAAAEVAVGLAILSMIYRNVKSIDSDLLGNLKN